MRVSNWWHSTWLGFFFKPSLSFFYLIKCPWYICFYNPSNVFKSIFSFPFPELHLFSTITLWWLKYRNTYLASLPASSYQITFHKHSQAQKLSVTFECLWDKARIPPLIFLGASQLSLTMPLQIFNKPQKEDCVQQAEVLASLYNNLCTSTTVFRFCIYLLCPPREWVSYSLHASFHPPMLQGQVSPFPWNLTSSLSPEVNSRNFSC